MVMMVMMVMTTMTMMIGQKNGLYTFLLVTVALNQENLFLQEEMIDVKTWTSWSWSLTWRMASFLTWRMANLLTWKGVPRLAR